MLDAVRVSEVVVMGDGRGEGERSDEGGEALVAVYRHDVHKLRGRRHDAAHEEFLGVPVNRSVALGADGDAAVLSRPRGDPEATVSNHVSPYRLSLLTGEVMAGSSGVAETDPRVQSLVEPCDAERLHASWLTSDVAAVFNESVHYPYTSLKFHVLLAAALLDNYRAGYAFDELFVVVERGATSSVNPDVSEVMATPSVVPHRTVLWTPAVTLRVTGEPSSEAAAARVGCVPSRSFASVWSRLPQHPLGVDEERVWMVLDAQLRRIRSWSVALQYIEEFCARFDEGPREHRRRGADGASSGVSES